MARRWLLTPLTVSRAGLVMSMEVLDVSSLEKLKTALKGLSHMRLLLGTLAGPLALQAGNMAGQGGLLPTSEMSRF